VSFLALQIGTVRIRPCEVELLLVAFDTELKVFHTPLDYDASREHSKRDVESKAPSKTLKSSIKRRTSYDKSYGSLKHLEVSLVQSPTKKPLLASHDPPCLKLFINSLDHGSCSFLVTFPPDSLRQILHLNTLEMIIQSSVNISKHSIAEFVQFINLHQPVLLIFILIDESSWIGVSGVSFFALQIETVRIRPCEVELLLVAFDIELKVFHTPLDYDASCKHFKRDIESKAFFNCQTCQLSLNQEQQHIFYVLNAKPFKVAFLELL
nr:hypothetical protein [Tanacetum cinerariifolium]